MPIPASTSVVSGWWLAQKSEEAAFPIP